MFMNSKPKQTSLISKKQGKGKKDIQVKMINWKNTRVCEGVEVNIAVSSMSTKFKGIPKYIFSRKFSHELV